nr:7TM diverse intracellular signaling domain-containing protein [uncultured Arsenicibacter sp.]
MIRRIVTCLLILFCYTAFSQPVIRLGTSGSRAVYPTDVYVLTDSSRSLSVEQVRSPAFANRFSPNQQPSLSFGSSNAIIWLTFRLATRHPDDWLLESSNYMINDLRFYSLSARTGRMHVVQQGTHFLDSPKDIRHNMTYFRPFATSDGPDTVTCYLRVKNNMPLSVPMRLLTVRELAQESHRNDLFHGLIFGILVAMMLYNAFIWLTIRDVTYLFYISYVLLTILVTDVEGYVNELVMARYFPAYSHVANVFFSLTLVFILLFTRHFLNTARHAPKLNRLITLLLAGCALPQAAILSGFPVLSTVIMEGLIIVVALFLWGIGSYLLRQGVREARYYVLAWSALFSGAIIYVAQLNGWLPKNLLTTNGVRVGTALETILLSFALADRISVYRREQQQAEMRLLETRREAGETRARLTESENKLLRAQMNPHFLFNSLNSIQRFILSKDPLTAARYLSKFADLMRFNLDQSRTASIPLQSEIDMLTTYLELESLRFTARFSYHFSVDPALNTYAIHIPGMMLQPFAENAVWHGLMHKPDAGEIRISFRPLSANSLRCVIEDNGIGRSQAALADRPNRIEHRSAGLLLTSERLQLLQPDHPQPLRIDDLYHADGTPAGTRVTIDLPVL